MIFPRLTFQSMLLRFGAAFARNSRCIRGECVLRGKRGKERAARAGGREIPVAGKKKLRVAGRNKLFVGSEGGNLLSKRSPGITEHDAIVGIYT